MAKERWFTGFEAGEAHDLNVVNSAFPSRIVCDATARTGDFHFQVYHPNATAVAIRCTKTLTGSFTCTNNGDRVLARMQIGVWVSQYPGATIQLYGWSTGGTVAPAQDARVYLNTDGTVAVQTAASIATIATVNSGFRLALNRWYILRLEFTYQRNDAGTDPTSATIWIYDGATMDAPDGPVVLAQATCAGAIAIASFAMLGSPTLGTALSTVSARIIKYDDWWYSIADGADADPLTNPDLAWPTGSRIAPVLITRQVASTWTGGFDLVREVPNSAVAGNEQTATGAGLSSIFGHQTAAQLNLIPPSEASPLDPPPPFTGAIAPIGSGGIDGFSSMGGLYFGVDAVTGGHDAAIPVPSALSVTPTAGGGQYSGGVWVRAATLKLRSVGGLNTYRTSPWTAAQYVSSDAYPNFSLDITATLNAATPADGFEAGTNGPYVRYGIIVLVTNAFSGAGPFDPSTGPWTGLSVSGGEGVLDASPFGSLVALCAAQINVWPPYPSTNPGARPLTFTFPSLTSPRQQSLGGASAWIAVFRAPTTTGSAHLPVCAAIKVYANLKRTVTTGNDNILIDGVATSVPSGTVYLTSDSLQTAYDWTEKTQAEFDALTFGVQTGSAIATQFGNILAEVMTAGPTLPRSNVVSIYRQKAGSFLSNASFQTISCGFRPSYVFVKRSGVTAAAGALKCWWMGGTLSWTINQIVQESIAIMDLTDDGFVVGPSNSANGAAATYAYVAVADGVQDVNNGAYAITGSYFREATTESGVVPIGFPLAFVPTWTPDFVWINGGTGVVKTPEIAAGSALLLSSGGALVADAITALGDGSFTIGTNTVVGNAGQYPFIAMRSDAGGLLASVFDTGTFVGTGANLDVPLPFTPELTVAAKPGGGYTHRWRSTSGHAGTNSVPWPGGAVTATDIIAIGASQFTAGTTLSLLGVTGYWVIWKGDGSFGTLGDTDIPPGDGGGGGGGGGDTLDPNAPPDICSGGGLKLFPPSASGTGCVKC